MARPCKKPTDWSKAVAVAWCFVLGQNTSEASQSTQVSESAIKNWKASPWWNDAYQEALDAVPAHFGQLALGALDAGLKAKDQTSARYALDRLVPVFAPPTVKQHIDGGIDLNVMVNGVGTDDDESE